MITTPGPNSKYSALNRALREQPMLQVRTETYSDNTLHIVLAFANPEQRDRINDLILGELITGNLDLQLRGKPGIRRNK